MSSSAATTATTDGSSFSSWVVKFVPFSSSVESSFWVEYCQKKLDTIRLSQDPVPFRASYGPSTDRRLQVLSQHTAINTNKAGPGRNDRIVVNGTLIGYNTLESLQQVNKNQLIRQHLPLAELLKPSLLLLTYADLKNHRVLYWFAMPALTTLPEKSIRATSCQIFPDDQQEEVSKSMMGSSDDEVTSCAPYFLYIQSTKRCRPLEDYESLKDQNDMIFAFWDSGGTNVTDPTHQPTMGWPMRNLVAHLSLHLNLGGQPVSVLSYRPTSKSLLLRVTVPLKEDYGDATRVVGWESHPKRQKPLPRWVNLQPLLDETHLAIQAADLNLKLMKWRMIPSLDVESLQNQRVLLLGAGTLGCNVARVLLGWGIRKFQIVDYGTVSYSNPVRQSLFTLEDCGGTGDRSKSIAAAQALQKIAANVEAEGHILSIPMPGHAAEGKEQLRETVGALDRLVEQSDVVFLLTDTRESRWLPTVMCAAHDKLMINAALGLDSWLVMRHGGWRPGETKGQLGCYFCNDVVAPENSMKNRTLDQQCTVTRPGLAPIASSMAVELMVSLLHHPQQHHAPASSAAPTSNYSPDIQDGSSGSPLGVIPHQIRGSLVSYQMMTPTVPAFEFCTGCSSGVVEAFKRDKVELMYQVSKSTDSKYLEDLAGLTEFRAQAASKLEDLAGEDDEEEWGL